LRRRRFLSRLRSRHAVFAWGLALGLVTVVFVWLLPGEEPSPQVIVQMDEDDENVIARAVLVKRGDHFYAQVTLNDSHTQEFMIDTGASSVALGGDVARRLNLRKERTMLSSTANGMVFGYSTTLDSVRLGDIVLRDVEAGVLPDQTDLNLLGMSFLSRLSWRQEGNTLVLTQRRSP
jgi:aspartyl protease family protein